MVKQNFLTRTLLLFALIVGSTSVWGQETIATATFNGKNATYTEGWSTTGTGNGRTDCIIIGAGENITSPGFDLSGYSKVTISIKARRYGTLTDKKATIDASIGGTSVGTTDATGTDATTSLTDITFKPTPSMTAAVLVFTCTNASSAGSSHGAGINTITLTGVKQSTGTLESIVISGDYPTSFYVGDDFSHTGMTVTANYSDEFTADVTDDATFTGYDMNATGSQTVTVSYTEGEVTATTTYSIEVTEKPSHIATFSVNGTISTEDVKEGEDIPFPKKVADIAGKTFVGWASTEISGTTDETPTLVTSATMGTSDVTYYAVFATNNGGTETVTLTASHTTNNETYAVHTYTDDKENTWTGNTNEPYDKDSKKARIGLRSSSGSYLESPTFAGNVTAISILTFNGAGKDRKFYINSEKGKNKTGDLGTVTAPTGEKLTTEHEATLGDTDFNHFFIEVSDALGFGYIKVTYSTVSYTGYCTTVPASTATITLNAVCTDGEMVYGTFSCDKAFVVSEDIVVSEIGIVDGALFVESYETGDVVPANTGVMVSALEGGDYEVELSTEEGTSVLGEENCLRPTGSGITATGMAAADEDCLYYRLTMHGGTTLGFYWGAAEGAAFAVAANKAYMAVPKTEAESAPYFSFDSNGETTAISAIGNGQLTKDNVYYDLSGRRIAQPTKGLYIVNGKKVIIK
jgi:hypothetical protein